VAPMKVLRIDRRFEASPERDYLSSYGASDNIAD